MEICLQDTAGLCTPGFYPVILLALNLLLHVRACIYVIVCIQHVWRSQVVFQKLVFFAQSWLGGKGFCQLSHLLHPIQNKWNEKLTLSFKDCISQLTLLKLSLLQVLLEPRTQVILHRDLGSVRSPSGGLFLSLLLTTTRCHSLMALQVFPRVTLPGLRSHFLLATRVPFVVQTSNNFHFQRFSIHK